MYVSTWTKHVTCSVHVSLCMWMSMCMYRATRNDGRGSWDVTGVADTWSGRGVSWYSDGGIRAALYVTTHGRQCWQMLWIVSHICCHSVIVIVVREGVVSVLHTLIFNAQYIMMYNSTYYTHTCCVVYVMHWSMPLPNIHMCTTLLVGVLNGTCTLYIHMPNMHNV